MMKKKKLMSNKNDRIFALFYMHSAIMFVDSIITTLDSFVNHLPRVVFDLHNDITINTLIVKYILSATIGTLKRDIDERLYSKLIQNVAIKNKRFVEGLFDHLRNFSSGDTTRTLWR